MAKKHIKIEEFFHASDHKLIIRDIFAMYHHEWDSIGEGVQNAVDSVLERREQTSENYAPRIKITYNARVREIVIEDNGIGIERNLVKNIVAPHVSMKNPLEANRGEFGVGLTFVAFSSNDFELHSTFGDGEATLKILNGYSWAMDGNGNEQLDITYGNNANPMPDSLTRIRFKPVRFPVYTIEQLEYVLRRFTAVGDFWSCYNSKDGPIKVTLNYIPQSGKDEEREIPNKFWHPADFLSQIDIESVDVSTIEKELAKGKEAPLPNWIGFGLIEKDKVVLQGLEFTYYALICRTQYYRMMAKKLGIAPELADDSEDLDETTIPIPATELLNSGIFVSKKGMPLGAIVEHPRTAQAGYWRGIFIMMNCDNVRTEPGGKKLHALDEPVARVLAKDIFNKKLFKYSRYVIPNDPDEEIESLLRNVDKNLQLVREQRKSHPLAIAEGKINIFVEPASEQTLIALFHELIGAKLLSGYYALKLSAVDTYDGIYMYKAPKDLVGVEHWTSWLRQFKAHERTEHEKSGLYVVPEMIVEFKMHVEDVIKDFLQKSKYHPHIKLLVAWDADRDAIQRRGWLLEELSKPKRKFHGAHWRLRPSSEGQTKGILATDVLLLKDFVSDLSNT
jgi:hypothetical protein